MILQPEFKIIYPSQILTILFIGEQPLNNVHTNHQ